MNSRSMIPIGILLSLLSIQNAVGQKIIRLNSGTYIAGASNIRLKSDIISFERNWTVKDVAISKIDYIMNDSEFMYFDSLGDLEVERGENLIPLRATTPKRNRMISDYKLLHQKKQLERFGIYARQYLGGSGVAISAGLALGIAGAVVGVIYEDDLNISTQDLAMTTAFIGYVGGYSFVTSSVGHRSYGYANGLGSFTGSLVGAGVAVGMMALSREFDYFQDPFSTFGLSLFIPGIGSVIGYNIQLKNKRIKRLQGWNLDLTANPQGLNMSMTF